MVKRRITVQHLAAQHLTKLLALAQAQQAPGWAT